MRRRCLHALLHLLLPLSFSVSASSEPSAVEIQHARKLAPEAFKAEEEGRWRDAADLFTQSSAMNRSSTLRWHAGHCRERLGELVQAKLELERALLLLDEDRSVKGADGSRKRIEAERDALVERIPAILLRPKGGYPGIEAIVDGRVIQGPLGREIELNPGPHAIVVTAPEHSRFELRFQLTEREHRTVDVELSREVPTQVGTVQISPTPSDALKRKERSALPRTLTIIGEGLLGAAGIGMVIESQLQASQDARFISGRKAELGNDSAVCHPTNQGMSAGCQELSDAVDHQKNAETRTAIGIGLAAGAGVAFLATWFLWSTAGTQTILIERATIVPTPSGVVLSGAFR